MTLVNNGDGVISQGIFQYFNIPFLCNTQVSQALFSFDQRDAWYRYKSVSFWIIDWTSKISDRIVALYYYPAKTCFHELNIFQGDKYELHRFLLRHAGSHDYLLSLTLTSCSRSRLLNAHWHFAIRELLPYFHHMDAHRTNNVLKVLYGHSSKHCVQVSQPSWKHFPTRVSFIQKCIFQNHFQHLIILHHQSVTEVSNSICSTSDLILRCHEVTLRRQAEWPCTLLSPWHVGIFLCTYCQLEVLLHVPFQTLDSHRHV